MRTTLNLEDDALLVAKRVAQRERLSLGEAVSRLVRAGALAGPRSTARYCRCAAGLHCCRNATRSSLPNTCAS